VLLDAHSLQSRDRAWNAESRWIEGRPTGVFGVRQVEPRQCVGVQDDHAPAGESVTGYRSVRRRKDRTPVEVIIGAAPVSPRVAAW